jgi:hypothetical protein
MALGDTLSARFLLLVLAEKPVMKGWHYACSQK